MVGTLHTSGRPLSRDAARALALLTEAGGQPMTLAALADHGVQFPGQAVYELQLAGFDIDRVSSGDDPHHSGYRVAASAAD